MRRQSLLALCFPLAALLAAGCSSSRAKRDETTRQQSGALGTEPADVPLWSRATAAAAWQPRDGASLVHFGDRFWLLGGWDGGRGYAAWYGKRTTNEIWSSTDLAAWTLHRPTELLPTTTGPLARWTRRHSAGVLVHPHAGRDHVYVIGGDQLAAEYDEFYASPSNGYQTDVWRTADMVAWEQVAASGSHGFAGRMLMVVGSFAGSLWVMGGQDGILGEPKTTLHNDVWRSQDGGATWDCVLPDGAAGPRRWSPRGLVSKAVSWRGRMWLVGGGTYDTYEFPTRALYAETWSTGDGVTWEKHRAPPWAPREYHSVEIYDDRLWVIGGYDGQGDRADIWVTEDGESWSRAPDAPWRSSHADAVAVGPVGLVHASGHTSLESGLSEVHYLACATGRFLADGTCIVCSCATGEFAAGGCEGTMPRICESCEASCAVCDGAGPGRCQQCAPSTWRTPTATCAGCSTCPSGSYIAQACGADRDTVCATCDPSCASCEGEGPAQCTSCPEGAYLSGGACLPCTTCSSSAYEAAACSPNADTSCRSCDEHCEACTGPGPSDCSSCPSTRYLVAGACVECSVCGEGEYPSAACVEATDTACAPCDSSCKTCTGPGAEACAECPPEAYLEAGRCRPCTVCGDDEQAVTECTLRTDRLCAARPIEVRAPSVAPPCTRDTCALARDDAGAVHQGLVGESLAPVAPPEVSEGCAAGRGAPREASFSVFGALLVCGAAVRRRRQSSNSR